jgi:hypothetical protein
MLWGSAFDSFPGCGKTRHRFELARYEKSGRVFLFLGLTRRRTDETPGQKFHTLRGILTYTIICVE